MQCIAQGNIIQTVAGNGNSIYSGDNIPAIQASIGGPAQLALDSRGNLYITDVNNSRIRKVDLTSGLITTVAGGGSGADGGLAVNAALNSPCGIRLDAADNIYISESCVQSAGGGGVSGQPLPPVANGRIRKIDAQSGIINTIAGSLVAGPTIGDGGLALNATLNTPVGLAIDASGNIFVADSANQRVRRIDAVSGVIATIVGNGIGGFNADGGPGIFTQLNNPTAVAVDAQGNLYIADSLNHRIRKWSSVTGLVSTVAGTGIAGFTGDGPAQGSALNFPIDLAFSPNGDLYIADAFNNRIRKLDLSTGLLTTVAGGGFGGDGLPATSSILNFPAGIVISPTSVAYLSDRRNNRVRAFGIPSAGVNTSISLSATPNPAVLGATVTVTASVNPATASGLVNFLAGGAVVRSVSLVNGSASFTAVPTGPGPSILTAQYAGSSGFLPSTSAPLTVQVIAPATVTLSSSQNPSTTGQAVTLMATVVPAGGPAGAVASGTVQFLAGATVLGTLSLTNGSVSLTTSQLALGNNSIQAVYSGDASNAPATSPVFVQTVQAPPLSCRVVYTVNGQWPGGFNTSIVLYNTGNTVINPWTLSWTWPGDQRITQSWNGNFTQSGRNATIRAASWNQRINPGASIQGIGFNGSFSGSNTRPAVFLINGVACAN